MSLQGWQNALAELVTSNGTRAARADLTDAESGWLSALPDTAGFRLTCTVQRWWRKLAVAEGAPLVLALLAAFDHLDVLDAYFATHWSASLFPLVDALGFLEFARTFAPHVPHLDAVVSFEIGMLRLGRAVALEHAPDSPIGGQLIRFAGSPADILGALIGGERPPAPDERDPHWLVLDPSLPNWSRLASPDEVAAMAR